MHQTYRKRAFIYSTPFHAWIVRMIPFELSVDRNFERLLFRI